MFGGGDSSLLCVPDWQCLHQSGKALQHDSPFSIILTVPTIIIF